MEFEDTRPPCIGELTKGCSMANTELLIETLAHKVEVLKERLAQSQPHDSDHLTACKMECVLSLLPLILSRQDGAAGVVPVDTNRLMHLEAERAKLKEEVKAAERRCKECPKCPQLEEQVKTLQSEKAGLEEQVKTLAAQAPALTFDQIAQATFGGPSEDCSQLRQQLAERNTQLERVMAQLQEAADRMSSIPKSIVSPEQYNQLEATYRREIAQVQAQLEQANVGLAACQDQLGIAAGAVSVSPPPPPPPPPPPSQAVLGCQPLSTNERQSINELINTARVPSTVRVEIQRDLVTQRPLVQIAVQIARFAESLKTAYMRLRPRLFSEPAMCSDLRTQYEEDMKKLVGRLGCQWANAVRDKAAINGVTAQVDSTTPGPLRGQVDECLVSMTNAQNASGIVNDLDTRLVNALQALFTTWVTDAAANQPPGLRDVIHGIFCPLLPNEGECTWPNEVEQTAQSAVWAQAWNGTQITQ